MAALDILIFAAIAVIGYLVVAWIMNLGRVKNSAETWPTALDDRDQPADAAGSGNLDMQARICPERDCQELNTLDARFCRRCGRELDA